MLVPLELLRLDLEQAIAPPDGVFVGMPEDERSRLDGYLHLSPAGGYLENIAITRQRANVYAVHRDVVRALELAELVRQYLHERGRRVIEAHDGERYLIHRTWCSDPVGTVMPAAAPVREFVIFADYLIGNQPAAATA